MSTEAERAIRMVREAPLLAFDTEASGLDWRHNFPIGYVFCADGKEALYIPVRAGGGGNLPGVSTPASATEAIKIHPFEKQLSKAFKERSQRSTFTTFGHHLKFDAHMAANVGVMLGRNLSCTQNQEVLIDENARSFSLEAAAERHNVESKKGEELYRHIASLFGCTADRKAMAFFWQLSGNDKLAVEYAKGDGITTFQLYKSQLKQIEDQYLQQIKKLEDDLIWTLFRIERRGVKTNVSYLKKLAKAIEDQVNKAEEQLPKDFNVRSPVDVKRYLEEAGHTNWPTTTLGNPSFTEKWLKSKPEGKNIVRVRKLSNLLNSFIGPLMEHHIFKGRVHATFNQLRSDEGGTPARLSCSNPNMQQIPKRDSDLAPMFRKAFIPDEGMEFNEADWSQCEPRLYAHYSQEPKLLEGYNKTPFDDIHDIVAKLLMVERDPTAKRMDMGIFTGMYPKTFAEHMDWPLDKATDKWNQWHAMLPNIRKFQDQAKQVLLQRGYVKTILGRRLRLDNPRFAYKGASKIIQGGNADIMKYKLIEVDKLLESSGDKLAHLLLTVHDSFSWQSLKTKEGKELSKEMCHIAEDVQIPPFDLRVPFVIEHHAGKNWAEATWGDKS